MKLFTSIITLLFILTGCDQKKQKDYSPFIDYDFSSGEYRLCGISDIGQKSDYTKKYGDFYIDEKDELNRIRDTWSFDSSAHLRCGWDYTYYLFKNDSLISTFNVNTECNYLISGTFYEFNPSLMDEISKKSIVHIDSIEGQEIRLRIRRQVLREKKRPKVLILPTTGNGTKHLDTISISKYFETQFEMAFLVYHANYDNVDSLHKTLNNQNKRYEILSSKDDVDFVLFTKLDAIEKGRNFETSIELFDVKKDTVVMNYDSTNIDKKDLFFFLGRKGLRIYRKINGRE